MSKRAEEAAFRAYPDYPSMDGGYVTQRKQRHCYIKGFEQAEKDLIPLINRLCEAILFDWDNKVELAWEIQSKIKDETK